MKHYSRASMNDWSIPDVIPDPNQKIINVYEEKIRFLEREIKKIRKRDCSDDNTVEKREIPHRVQAETELEILLKRNLNLIRNQRDEAINRMLSFQKELTAVMKDMNHLQHRCNEMVHANELLLQVATGLGIDMYLHESKERVKVEWTGDGTISSPAFTQNGYGVRVNSSKTLLALKEGSNEGVVSEDGDIDLGAMGLFQGYKGNEILDARRSYNGRTILIELPIGRGISSDI